MPLKRLLGYAAAVESRAEHPVAAAIVSHARAMEVAVPTVTRFASLPGMGVEGEVDGAHVVIGNERLFEDRNIPVASVVPGLSSARAVG
jgi:cation transport ATPase